MRTHEIFQIRKELESFETEMYNHVDYVIDYRNRLRLYNRNRNRNH